LPLAKLQKKLLIIVKQRILKSTKPDKINFGEKYNIKAKVNLLKKCRKNNHYFSTK